MDVTVGACAALLQSVVTCKYFQSCLQPLTGSTVCSYTKRFHWRSLWDRKSPSVVEKFEGRSQYVELTHKILLDQLS